MPYFLKSVKSSLVIISPLTAIGTAGGQETVLCAQIRPTESSTEIVSEGENAASRIEHALA